MARSEHLPIYKRSYELCLYREGSDPNHPAPIDLDVLLKRTCGSIGGQVGVGPQTSLSTGMRARRTGALCTGSKGGNGGEPTGTTLPAYPRDSPNG